MDDIIILPNGGQMDGPDAWGSIIQTAKRKPPIETMSDLDRAVRESHEGFGKMGGAGDLLLATPTGVDIKTMQLAKATVSMLLLFCLTVARKRAQPIGLELVHVC
jgi:hypothetical protein